MASEDRKVQEKEDRKEESLQEVPKEENQKTREEEEFSKEAEIVEIPHEEKEGEETRTISLQRSEPTPLYSSNEAAIQTGSHDKNLVAQQKVRAAKEQVMEVEEEMEQCLKDLENDLKEFEEYEREELLPTITKSRALLQQVGASEMIESKGLSPVLELESSKEKDLQIKNLSTGKIGAFFLALVGGVITLLGWYLFAVSKAGLSLPPSQMPDLSVCSSLAAKIAEVFGQGENASVGGAIVLVTSLLVMGSIYWILISLRASRNLREAEKIEEEASLYCQEQEECKMKMEQVHEHLQEFDRTVRKYEVLLGEKNAQLRRALHIEDAPSYNDLHEKSQETVQQIQTLLEELEKLLETPVSRSGILTQESIDALRHAKRMINDHILRLYA